MVRPPSKTPKLNPWEMGRRQRWPLWAALVLTAPGPLPSTALPRGLLDVTAPPHSIDNTGATDVTVALRVAIQAALAANAAVFVPEGRYLVSDTLEIAQRCDLYRDRGDGGINIVPCRFRPNVIIGSTKALPRRPTLVLAPRSPGFGNASAPKNVVKLTNPVAENVNMNQAFRGIDIEVGEGNAGAIGLYACGAQGLSVNDVAVDMRRGEGGFAGFAGGNGAGGSHVNIAATGGRYGNFGITVAPFLTPCWSFPSPPARAVAVVLCSISCPWASDAYWCL